MGQSKNNIIYDQNVYTLRDTPKIYVDQKLGKNRLRVRKKFRRQKCFERFREIESAESVHKTKLDQ